MEKLQFYPTPPNLARKAWGKFKNRHFVRVLEPSAGNGDLAAQAPWDRESRGEAVIDCCEIDITRHPALKAAGINVVGVDCLDMRDGAIYSHIVMNPPFAEGAKHTLKAWDILWDGEIVAILNAETVRNPFSKERQMLARLIERHGSVEYIQDAFMDPDTQRKTEVDIALVHLRKEANLRVDIMGSILDTLKTDSMTASGLAGGYEKAQNLAVPATTIENAVTAFNAAVQAAREAVFADARQEYYKNLLGSTMEQRHGKAPDEKGFDSSREFVMRELQKRYDDLKNRAWAGILHSSQVLDKLSSAAQRRVESDFETIKGLAFTAANIYGFLVGVADSQGEIQIGMACDVFDLFTKYHSDNTLFYRGWKSNDRHRTCGMRLKTTRFILPGHKTESYSRSMNWNAMQLLRDIDKVFAMLDGKAAPEIGLLDIFGANFDELRAGERVGASYFDVRYYPGVGTIHFFPTRKDLVDRLNRLVGRHRQWLPPEGERVSEAFWLQYETAEQFDKEVRAEINKTANKSCWDDPLWSLFRDDPKRRENAALAIDNVLALVQGRRGIQDDLLTSTRPESLPLLTVA
ncbi:MAG: DUF4942 domain-containing protein [Acidiferrobacterales bacterium]